MGKLVVWLIFTFGVISAPASAEDGPAGLLERKLLASIEEIDRELSGVLGVVAVDLETGRRLEYNADVLFPQASSIKIPIMIEVFRQAEDGKLNLDQTVTLTANDLVGGSGHLQILLRSGPVQIKLRDLITAMIETSDNTATNRLISLVGRESVNAWLREAGFEQTKLQRRMLDSKAAAENRENVSTPNEMARLAEMLYRGKAITEPVSRQMIDILKLVRADFRASVPASVPVAAKPGELTGVRAETGIVFLPKRPFVLSVMSAFLDDGENPVPTVTRAVYEHFEKLAKSNRYGNKLQ